MIPHDRILPMAKEKTRSKDEFYGGDSLTMAEAWETMPIDSLAAAVKYKVDRATQLSTTFAKRLDDLEDAYNFVAAIYERILRTEAKPTPPAEAAAEGSK